ncbi:DUF5805 domain-containing protein [Haloarchaeobius sp. TZWWS8]|uniref:DUF5805 domain-containing protein n=1 Tax=Haloarchaeobius sp. TZWWS8 TaxID=3446121 RepID=UPI003EBC21DE
MSEDTDERVVVKTTVPAFQKSAWVDHADELEMSQSEFVRTMVQAGRKKFGVPESPDGGSASPANGPVSGESGTPADSGLEPRVLDILRDAEGAKSWDDLLADVSDDVESRLDDALQSLQGEGRVRYSGRDGGYVVTEG